MEISDSTRILFKAKFWRIGNTLSKMGGFKRTEKLQKWKDEYWQLEVDISEVKQNEMKRKLEDQLEKEQEKRRRLEQEVETLKGANKKLTKQIIYRNSAGRGPSSRMWQSYSRQQQLNKKKKMASELKTH